MQYDSEMVFIYHCTPFFYAIIWSTSSGRRFRFVVAYEFFDELISQHRLYFGIQQLDGGGEHCTLVFMYLVEWFW